MANLPGDDALRAAMSSLSGKSTGYVIRQRTMRALYADEVGIKLATRSTRVRRRHAR